MNPSVPLLILALAIGGVKDAGPQTKEEAARLRFTFKTAGRDGARAIQFSPDGTRLACAGWDGHVYVWDTANGTELLKIGKMGHEWTVLTFNPDGKNLVLGSFDGVVKVIDAAKGTSLVELEGHCGFISFARFLNDGKTLVTADSKGTVLFWDFAERKRLPNREMAVGEHAEVAITPDGKTLISTGLVKDGLTLNVWDTATRKKAATIEGLEGGILSIAVTADGKTAVTGSLTGIRDGVGTIWDMAARKPRATLVGHTREIFAVTLSDDDKTVITGSSDEFVKLWDIATGGERLTLEGGRGGGMVTSVAVSADGKLVAAGRSDTVSIWQLSRPASSYRVQVAKAKPGKKEPELSDKERRAIYEKAEALASQGPKGIAELAQKVRVGPSAWKIAAMWALESLGPEAEPAIDALIQELTSKESDLKSLVIETLTAIGPKAKAAIPAIIEAAKDTSDFKGAFRMGGPSNTAEAALEAVKAIDPGSMPRLAEALIPALMEVVEKGRVAPMHNALALLRQLGPHVKPALPRLKNNIAELPKGHLHDVLPIFLAAGEEGMAILADFMLDPTTTTETKVALMRGYRWEREAPPSAIRVVRVLLKHKSAAARASALQTLQTVRAKELIPILVELLTDFDVLEVPSDYRGDDPYYVASALANQGKDAVPSLIKALEHKEPLPRFQAARALAKIGKEANEALPALEARLNDHVPVIEIEAAKAILKLGKPHEKALGKLEQHLRADAKLLDAALDAIEDLGQAGRPLFPTVKKITLETTNFPLQRAGFNAIRRMKVEPKEVIQVWTKLINENPWFLTFPPEEEIRAQAKEVQSSLPVLLKYLQHKDVNVRRRVMEILTILGPAAREAIPELIKALEDENWVASGAVAALGAMGADAKPAILALVRKFENLKARSGKGREKEEDYHQSEILNALERIGPGAVEAIPKLIHWLPEHPRAARVLGKIGPAAKEALPALQKLHQAGTSYEKSSCAYALIKITGKAEPYVSELADLLQKSKDVQVRSNVIEVLRDLGPDARPALPALLLLVKQKSSRRSFGDADLRVEAAAALAQFGPDAKAAVPDLIDLVQTSYYRGQITAAETLGAIGPAAREAIPALEKMAQEDERFVPIVQQALAKIRAKQ